MPAVLSADVCFGLAWLETGTMTENEMLPYGLGFAAVILVAAIATVVYSNTKAKK